MEAELQERVESSQKQATHVVEIYECLKSTVDQLKAELDSGAGGIKGRRHKTAEDDIHLRGIHQVSLCIHTHKMWHYCCFCFQRAVFGRQRPNLTPS